MRELGVAMVGHGKMGRAHSQAYRAAAAFLDPGVHARLAVVAGRDRARAEAFAWRFGWEEAADDWRAVVGRPDIDLVDVCTPSANHEEIAVEAARRGKHVLVEKPLAVDAAGARRMLEAAEAAGVRHMVVFNYRFAPAVALARRLIAEGALGEVREFAVAFRQDWLADPAAPMTWRLRRETAGSGALGDLGAHLVDLVRYLLGDVQQVCAQLRTVVDKRPGEAGALEPVTVDDAVEALVTVEGGATGTLIATRVAAGHACGATLEVNGSRGSLRWDFQRMNELDIYTDADPPDRRGWRTISVTAPGAHPWADRWWGRGHVLGYDHTFHHQIGELLAALAQGRAPRPDFRDGLRCQETLDAMARSSRERRWARVDE